MRLLRRCAPRNDKKGEIFFAMIREKPLCMIKEEVLLVIFHLSNIPLLQCFSVLPFFCFSNLAKYHLCPG